MSDYTSLLIKTPKKEIKQRPLAGKMVDYVDARYVQDTLDSTVGSNNWKFSYEIICLPSENHPGAIKGKLSVRYSDEWNTKEDVGEYKVNRFAAIKSGVSDALKRCAVHFGIARDLYSDEEVIDDVVTSPLPKKKPKEAVNIKKEKTKTTTKEPTKTQKKTQPDTPTDPPTKAQMNYIQALYDRAPDHKIWNQYPPSTFDKIDKDTAYLVIKSATGK